MGEIADMMLNGVLCECCGTFLGDEKTGFLGYCSDECARARGALNDAPEPAKHDNFLAIKKESDLPRLAACLQQTVYDRYTTGVDRKGNPLFRLLRGSKKVGVIACVKLAAHEKAKDMIETLRSQP